MGDARDTVYYDGGCALCHRSVRFLVARDRFFMIDMIRRLAAVCPSVCQHAPRMPAFRSAGL